MNDRGKLRTYLKVLVNLAIILVLILLLVFVVPKIVIYFMPFVLGWIIALIAGPPVHFFEKTLKIKRKAGSAFVIISVITLVILGGYVIGARLMEQAVNLVAELPQMWEGMQQDFARMGRGLEGAMRFLPKDIRAAVAGFTDNIGVYLGELVGHFGSPTLEALSRFAMNIPSIIIGIIMCLLSAYFFVAEREYLSVTVKGCIPEAVIYHWNLMSRSFKRAVGGYFKAQFKIEIWMYLLLVIGLWVLKVNYAFLIALGIAFLDFLPIFGTGTVLMPWAVIKILSADYKMAVGLMIIWCGGQLARQIIQPKIVGDSIGVPPIPTIFLLFIGYKAAGVFGMIIAVPIGIIFANMYEEGVFDTTKNSIRILLAGINNFRRLDEKDMAVVEEYEKYQREKIREQEK